MRSLHSTSPLSRVKPSPFHPLRKILPVGSSLSLVSYANLLILLLARFAVVLGEQWLNWNTGRSTIERCGDRQHKFLFPTGAAYVRMGHVRMDSCLFCFCQLICSFSWSHYISFHFTYYRSRTEIVHNGGVRVPRISRSACPTLLKIFTSVLVYVHIRCIQSDLFLRI